MTWHHVVLVIAALAAPLACGLHAQCGAVMPQVVTLSTMIVAGVLGHAGRKEKEELTGPGAAKKETSP